MYLNADSQTAHMDQNLNRNTYCFPVFHAQNTHMGCGESAVVVVVVVTVAAVVESLGTEEGRGRQGVGDETGHPYPASD